MNKKRSISGVLALTLVVVNMSAWAVEIPLKEKLTQVVAAHHFSRNGYKVRLVAQLQKDVRLQDTMFRPARGAGQDNPVIDIKTKTLFCDGILIENGSRVLTPSACVQAKGYQLKKVTLRFKNGEKWTGYNESATVREDLAWLAVPQQVTAHLPSIALAPVPSGKTLQEEYGPDMTQFLREFYYARGVAYRHLRLGQNREPSRLRVGEPVIYKGKVVALVKEAANKFNIWSRIVSESPLAIIR